MLEFTILTISVLGIASLGFLVWNANRHSLTNQLFLHLVIVTILWLITTYLAVKVDPNTGIFLVRLTMLLAAFQILFLFLFVHTFPGNHLQLSKKIHISSVVGAFVVGTVAMTPYMFTSINNGSATPGPAIVIFLLYAAALVGNALYVLIRKTLRSRGILKLQLRYLTFGIVVTFGLIALFNFLSVLLFKNTHFTNFTPVYILILIGSIAYAIITQHLFDIRVIIRRTVIFAVLLAFVFAVYTTMIVIITQVFQQTTTTSAGFIANLLAALLIGFSFEPLRRWISERTDKWLFQKEYEQQVVIRDLGKKLNDVIDLDEALEIVMQTIARVLHLHHAVTYVFQPGENSTFAIKRVKQIGYNSAARLILEDKDFTVPYFTANPAILVVEEMRLDLEREKELLKDAKGQEIREHAIRQAVYRKLSHLDVAVAVPLQLNNTPIGLIFLSEKETGGAYGKTDLALLELVGAQAISSIQKAKLYEGDQMKSEFVSIASHELLTPVSAIEGYLSMILEEHIGKVDKQAEDYLTKVYSSAKRLSLLIKDLLSVSRIESGKMKIAQQQLDIDKSIKDVLDQLKFIAANKKIALHYTPPTEPLPPVWADPDRTTQILVNLVSNGIKYTPEGSVTIATKLLKHEGLIEIAVSDTGMGMSKQAMSHLFSKFYRVDSPETAGIVGTGLGLYITKSLIEKMGGTITVKSTVGKGSTFSFVLPIFKVETSALE